MRYFIRKTYRILPVIFTLIMIKSFATDHRNDVKTPKGTNVEAWVTDEMTDNERAYWDVYYITRYPNAVMMPTIDYNHSSTRTFNCHGYAWDIVEKWQGVNEARWIGYINNDPEYKYWQDGSYIESTSPVYPGKANWSNGDHSAVTTSTSGVLISKWGSGPLMRHNWNYSPYGSSGIKYYKLSPPTITGNSPLCFSNQSSYTETKFTGNIDLTYQWSCNGLVSAAGLSNQSA